MNMEQVKSLIKTVLAFVGGIVVTKGYVSAANLEIVIGAIMSVAVAGYTIYSNTKANVISVAANLAEVDHIKVNDPTLAGVSTPANVTTTNTVAPGVMPR